MPVAHVQDLPEADAGRVERRDQRLHQRLPWQPRAVGVEHQRSPRRVVHAQPGDDLLDEVRLVLLARQVEAHGQADAPTRLVQGQHDQAVLRPEAGEQRDDRGELAGVGETGDGAGVRGHADEAGPGWRRRGAR